MQKFIPKTNDPNGRNNSKENYEESRKIRKRSKQEEVVYDSIAEESSESKTDSKE